MPVKIRLQRHGKKGHPYFHIVVADARSPRDGKYIERLGFYNPNTNPATIEIDVDGAAKWLNNGAQPTDTARAILSYKGVLYKNHLMRGVAKGAFTEEQSVEKFNAWLEEKALKIDNKKKGLSEAASKASVDRLRAETEVNKTRAAALAAANAPVVEEAEAPSEEVAVEEATTTEAPVAEATTTEAPVAEAPVAEAPVAEAPVAEAPAEDVPVAEAPVVEAPVVEAPAEEAPVADAPAEEAPAAKDESKEDKA